MIERFFLKKISFVFIEFDAAILLFASIIFFAGPIRTSKPKGKMSGYAHIHLVGLWFYFAVCFPCFSHNWTTECCLDYPCLVLHNLLVVLKASLLIYPACMDYSIAFKLIFVTFSFCCMNGWTSVRAKLSIFSAQSMVFFCSLCKMNLGIFLF